jgi:hypothetical protein
MDGRQRNLEAVFEPGGIWTELLKRAPGYLATEVECESASEGRYRVRDFWTAHRWFEIFREKHADDYERLKQWLSMEGVVERERFLGAYYEDDPGDELVPG